MKKFVVFNPADAEFESFDTIEEAREYIDDVILDTEEGYHPDAEDFCILEIREKVKLTVTDQKSNYKYESEEDVPEGEEAEGNVWPYSNEFDTVCNHEFIPAE